MPLGTLDRSPPPFFKQGPSALTKLAVLGALAVLLMVTDNRFAVTQVLRSTMVTLMSPLQWLALQPVAWSQALGQRTQSLQTAQEQARQMAERLAAQSHRAAQVEDLHQENQRLRALLGLRERVSVPGLAAQVLYDGADPYSQRIVIDQGSTHGVQPGAPVLDESGVLGQITRVHPLTAEATLLTDRAQLIPVLNTRTGVRSVAHGSSGNRSRYLELRFMAGNADVQEGDILTTSGVDAVYPPGLPVAKVVSVQRQADSAFARVLCEPFARIDASRHVLVLAPTGPQLPAPPAVELPTKPSKHAGKPGRAASTHREAPP